MKNGSDLKINYYLIILVIILKMVNYQNGKIYKIVTKQSKQIYIGSTTQTLDSRLDQHKGHYVRFLNKQSHYVTSYEILKYNDAMIILIENYSCNNKEELFTRERYWRERTPNAVNIIGVKRKGKPLFVDYKNGKIYKIISKNTLQCYVGSTAVPKLTRRLVQHKDHYRKCLKKEFSYITSFELVKYGDCQIELIENYPCNDENELRKREGLQLVT